MGAMSRGMPTDASTGNYILEVKDLTVRYSRRAIGCLNVSLNVGHGEAVVLLGPNGAGKSSTLRGVAGILPSAPGRQAGGSLKFKGVELAGMEPSKRARLGLAMVPERDKVFSELSVADNLRVVGGRRRRRRSVDDLDHSMNHFPELKAHANRKAGLLSGGQRQMLALAMGLSADPSLLIVDELTLGLSPGVSDRLAEKLVLLRKSGLPLLLAEQSPAIARRVATTVCVMEGGEVVGSGDPAKMAKEMDAVFLGGV